MMSRPNNPVQRKGRYNSNGSVLIKIKETAQMESRGDLGRKTLEKNGLLPFCYDGKWEHSNFVDEYHV